MTMETDSPILMSQFDLQTLVLNMKQDITAHHSALEELNTLKTTILGLQQKNSSLTFENEQLRQQVAALTVSNTANRATPTASTNIARPQTANQTPKAHNAAKGPNHTQSPWTEVVKKHTKTKRVRDPQQVTDKHRQSITRGFNLQADGPQGYTTVYIHRSRRFTRTEVRNNLHLIGAEASRIVDITFPARNVIGVLIHAQFKVAFLAILEKNHVGVNLDFDPVDPKHVADPKYHELTLSKREEIAFELHLKRCSKSLEYLANRRSRLFASVATYFLNEGWTTTEEVANMTPANSLFGSRMRADVDIDMSGSDTESL